ncbi:MAG TPA: Spy/CpxP family protein refolding chaperone [Thiobacillaceae bacterium]|nr:Spy/CpxP family protein refolding chaperone [Thiobacillaceae bacterium]
MNRIPFARRTLLAALIAGGGMLAGSIHAADGVATPRCEPGYYGPKNQAAWHAERARQLGELKEKLKLAPEQEAAWKAFADVSVPAARMGAGRQAMRDDLAKLDTPQRLDRMLAMSEARRARMVERIEATKALYAQLNPEQKRVFDAEAFTGMPYGYGKRPAP